MATTQTSKAHRAAERAASKAAAPAAPHRPDPDFDDPLPVVEARHARGENWCHGGSQYGPYVGPQTPPSGICPRHGGPLDASGCWECRAEADERRAERAENERVAADKAERDRRIEAARPASAAGHASSSGTADARTNSANPKRVAFLQTLLAERKGTAAGDALRGEANGLWKAGRMDSSEVARLIAAALALPKASAQPAAPAQPQTRQPLPEVPEGYYATASRTGNNDLDFWAIDRPTEGRWAGRVFVKRVVGGRADQNVRGPEARLALEAIAAAGPEDAARLYGQEVGRCGRCNRHLTDETSRAYGLGPECRKQGL